MMTNVERAAMLDTDFDTMSLAELKLLKKHITKAIAMYEQRKKKLALHELENRAVELGFSLSEIAALATRKSGGEKGRAKYRHPEDPNITWVGRGRHPDWFRNAVRSGISADDLLV